MWCDVLARFSDESGGALFNIGLLTITDALFEGNTAADGGLAIANEPPPLDMGNVTFNGNMLSCLFDEYRDLDQVNTAVSMLSSHISYKQFFCNQPNPNEVRGLIFRLSHSWAARPRWLRLAFIDSGPYYSVMV